MRNIAIITSTRPELIRLSLIIKKAKKYFDVTHIYTNQNFDYSLSDQFFKEFDIYPDIILNHDDIKYIGNNFIGRCFSELENIFNTNDFDAVLILGDTNGAFVATSIAKRHSIPIFHMEAGNRCYDERVPEEINRRQIDAISDWHLCYTQRAREQLLLEGHHPSKVIVVGNPIYEVMEYQTDFFSFEHKYINEDYYLTTIHRKENLTFEHKYINEDYYLATIHRKENLTSENNRLSNILLQLNSLDKKVKLSLHPTLKHKIKYDIKLYKNIEFFTPTNYKEFIELITDSDCVITDSGTIPEECNLLNKPCVLLRHSTERPELLEHNSIVLCSEPEDIKLAIQIAIDETEVTLDVNEYHSLVSNNVIKLLIRCNQK